MLNITYEDKVLMFEHSLVSMSKWESIYQKPFFRRDLDPERTTEEMLDYFKCMLVSPENEEHLVDSLTPQDYLELSKYINETRTATTVNEVQGRPGPKENVTSELIYYWMITFNIPWEAEHWHLSRLIMLVRVCGVKSNNKKQRPVRSQSRLQEMYALNEKRMKEWGTNG